MQDEHVVVAAAAAAASSTLPHSQRRRRLSAHSRAQKAWRSGSGDEGSKILRHCASKALLGELTYDNS
jgi:hypothetical protein